MAQGPIKKRGDSWTFRYRLPPDPTTGERKHKRETYDTYEEAKEAWAKRMVELNEGRYMEPSEWTISEFMDEWIETHKQNIKESTESQYRNIVENHIKPGLGNMKVKDLKPIQLQSWYNEKLKSGRADGKGGLSKRSVEYIHSVLNCALDYAVRWELIKSNPAKSVNPPRPRKKEMEYWTAEQIDTFLKTTRNHRLHALYRLALTTGMRQGEMLGLRWQDVELDQGVLHVRQVMIRRHHGANRITFGPPKTESSRRTIGLSGPTVKALKQHRIQQKEQQLRFSGYQKSDLVFRTRVGTPIRPRNLTRQFKRLAEEAGLPEIRFHDLRHSFATALLRAGVDADVVQRKLGHRDVSTTLDTYSHVSPDDKREAAETLERYISGNGG